MKKHSSKAKKATYFHGEKDKQFNIDSMKKYVQQKQELDKALEKLIAPVLKNGAPSVLDVCCGVGHLIYHFHSRFPRAQFTGIDQTPYLIKEARSLTSAQNVRFEVGDLYTLPRKYKKQFDVTICWKTLTWLHDYKDALRSLIALTRSDIFLSSLFYEGDIDYEIQVHEYAKERGKKGEPTYHNIYSLPRFEAYARAMGAKHIKTYDFNIGVDLPRGNIDHMGTYTVPLKNGGRMQMSGALPMPWKIVHIQL